MPTRASRLDSADVGILGVLLALAAAIYAWNDYTLTPFIGYDADGHARYIDIVWREGRLPHPLEGWSTFHPPLYYLVASQVWAIAARIDMPTTLLAVRGLGGIAILGVAALAYAIPRRRGATRPLAAITAAVVLFLPSAQMAASMVGNEAFAAGVSAFALAALLELHERPRDSRAACIAGVLVGLALIAKYTGVFVAGAALTPYLRRDWDRALVRSFVLMSLLIAAIAGPVYGRNLTLVGSPVPMTRELEPQKSAEESFVLRERRASDYLFLHPGALLRPSIYQVGDEAPTRHERNPIMTNVWGLAYASTWYDAFGHRIGMAYHRDGVLAGPLLCLLGLAPTIALLVGATRATGECLRSRGRSADTPLVVAAAIGLAFFVAFTWRAPATVAVKGSYLLPLLLPAAVFFASGINAFPPRSRTIALFLSAAAAALAALVFTNGLVFPPSPPL